jgi:hypothetical protein
VSGLENAKQI